MKKGKSQRSSSSGRKITGVHCIHGIIGKYSGNETSPKEKLLKSLHSRVMIMSPRTPERKPSPSAAQTKKDQPSENENKAREKREDDEQVATSCRRQLQEQELELEQQQER